MIDSSGNQTLLNAGGVGNSRDRRLESTFFMINVIFLLLLFFVVAGNLNMNIEISPPRADATQAMSTSAAQLVIDAKGRLRFNAADLELAALPAAIAAAGRIPELSISADAGVDAVVVAKVLEALAGSDIARITLVTLGRAGATPATQRDR